MIPHPNDTQLGRIRASNALGSALNILIVNFQGSNSAQAPETSTIRRGGGSYLPLSVKYSRISVLGVLLPTGGSGCTLRIRFSPGTICRMRNGNHDAVATVSKALAGS